MDEDKNSIFDMINKAFDRTFGRFNDALSDSVTGIVTKMKEVDSLSSSIANNFGVGRTNLEQISRSLTDSYTSISLLGGNITDIYNIQTKTSEALGKNVLQNKDVVKSLYETYLVTGQEVKVLTSNFKDIGFSTVHISEQMNKVVDSARLIGVSTTAVSGQAVKNMSKMNEFNFVNGVDGLAKMAAQAVSLRVDMSKTLDVASKLFDPEKAIDMAAAMQRLGVSQSDLLDPLRLMELAQNDPTELQNQIAQMTKQFVQLNEKGQFEIMPGAKRQLMEISKEIGIGYDTLTKMAIGGEELQDKMNKIRFPDTFTEEQKNLIYNMSQMGTSGKYEIMLNGKNLGIDEAMEKFTSGEVDVKKFMEDQKPKSIEDLAREQLSTSQLMEGHLAAIRNSFGYGVAGTKGVKESFDVGRVVSESLSEFYRSLIPMGKDTQQITKNMEDVGGDIANIGKDYLNNQSTFIESLQKLGEQGVKLEGIMKDNLGEAIINTADRFDKLREKQNSYIEGLDFIYNKIKTKYGELIPENLKTQMTTESKVVPVEQKVTTPNVDTQPVSKTTTSTTDLTVNVTINSTDGSVMNPESFKKIINDSQFVSDIKRKINELDSNYGMTSKPPQQYV